VLVGDPVKGQSAWAFTQSASGILIALMSPFLGAMADAGGRRKPFIFAFQLLLAAGCAGLAAGAWGLGGTGPGRIPGVAGFIRGGITSLGPAGAGLSGAGVVGLIK